MKKTPLKLIGMLSACCLIPILLTLAIPFITSSLVGKSILSFLASLICPIMMMIMMTGLFHNGEKGSCCSKKQDQ